MSLSTFLRIFVVPIGEKCHKYAVGIPHDVLVADPECRVIGVTYRSHIFKFKLRLRIRDARHNEHAYNWKETVHNLVFQFSQLIKKMGTLARVFFHSTKSSQSHRSLTASTTLVSRETHAIDIELAAAKAGAIVPSMGSISSQPEVSDGRALLVN